MIEDSQLTYDLIHEKPIPEFGPFLREICMRAKLRQPLLEKYGQAEYARLEREGRLILENDPPSSMLQQVISRVVNGLQRPSYIQTLIWINAIKQHYNSDGTKDYFKKKGQAIPLFTEEIENALWVLSGYQSPDMVKRAVTAVNGFDSITGRFPHATNTVTPQTDPHLKSTKSDGPHTGPLAPTTVYEI